MHTFVIPAYGESPFLESCVQSLMAQTVKSKIIMATSTPSALSKQTAEKYGLDYFVHDKTGIGNDWNFSLSKVITPLATIAHQDDIYEPDYAERMVSAFGKPGGENILIAFTDYSDLVNDQKVAVSLNSVIKKTLLLPFVIKNKMDSPFFKKLLLKFGDPVCCPSVTLNLKLLKDFCFSTEYSCILDWYAWYKIALEKGAFCFINQKLVRHRIHGESETTNQLSQGIRRKEEVAMLKMMWGDALGHAISWLYASGHKHNNAPLNK
jgi:glycosyltransferase involved in cell wall biosynthesis